MIRILSASANSGQYYESGTAPSLRAAKAIVRASRPGQRTYWREEGRDVAGYADRADMDSEDKAICRLRKAEEV